MKNRALQKKKLKKKMSSKTAAGRSTGKPESSKPKSAARSAKSGAGSNKSNHKKPTPTRTPSADTDTEDVTNFASAMRWLYHHTDFERQRVVHYNAKTFSLDRMRKLLATIGDPHNELKVVHVAGTKGKGSTCAMLASMLQACGYATGLYTSPHLIDLRERISINGQMISHSDLVDLFKLIINKAGDLAEEATFFEIMTAAALRYFADQAVDIVVLETGLGGRLDSTNVCKPLVCGLTHISLDHMNILGRDVATIAGEKAGIIKKGVPVISVEQDSAVSRVFEETAQQVGAPLEFTGRQIDFSFRFEANKELGPHTRVSVITPTSRWEHLPVPMKGEHQAHNCALALAMLDKLKAHGFTFPDDKVIAGLAATYLPGRMELVWSEPRVIVDGAHNGASIQALVRSLGAHIQYDSLIMIFGCGSDKDVNGMLKQVGLGADKVIFTKTKNNPRAVEPEDLSARFNELAGKMAQPAATLEDALKLAARAVTRDDLIVISGSFYLVGEAKKYFAELANRKKR